MKSIPKILIEQATGKTHLVKDPQQDYYTSAGTISKKQLQSNAPVVKSNTGKTFYLFPPTFADLWKELEKGPQSLVQKDIGLILAKTGVNKDSLALDAGGGMGSLAFSLANVCRKVVVYELREEYYQLLERNQQLLGMKNIIIKKKDIYQGIEEKNLDLLTLDLPEPWRVTTHAEQSLKPGAFLVAYLPNLTQVKQFIDAARGTSLNVVETVELLERRWKIEGLVMRPEFQMLGHTGFLTFGRKM